MLRLFATLARQAAIAVPVDPGPFTPGRVLATAIAVAGAIGFAKVITWFWAGVCRPLLDGYVLRALKREHTQFEAFIRGDIFDDDIEAAKIRETVTRQALELSKACAESLVEIRRTQQEQGRALEAIPRLAEATDRIGGALERLDTTLGDMRVEMGRQAGTLEQMQRTAKWDGATERRHGDRRDNDGRG